MPDVNGPVPAERISVERIGADRIRVRIGDREFEADAYCPHRKGHLAHGYVNAARLRITCPLHHSSFSLETGEAITGPTRTPLCVREITEQSPEPVN